MSKSFVYDSWLTLSKAKKNGYKREDEEIEYIALATSQDPSFSRVVWKESKIDIEEDEDMVGTSPKFVIPKMRLRKGQVVRVRRDWNDLHVYVLSSWVRKLWNVRPSLTSIQGDLLPLLIHRQFHGVKAAFGSSEEAVNAFQESLSSNLDTEYGVSALVVQPSRCMRANNVSTYMVACRAMVAATVESQEKGDGKVLIPPGSQINSKFNSMLLKDVELGEKVQVKATTVGAGCKLSSKCRLNNSIVMEGASIGDNTIIQNSVVGAGSFVGENCNLNECQVPPGKIIPAGTKEKGETFSDGF